MVKMEQRVIGGRTFGYKQGTDPWAHEEEYTYRGMVIAREWIDVGWDDRWGNYREQTIRRWIIVGVKPYHTHNFTSVTKAANYLDRIRR